MKNKYQELDNQKRRVMPHDETVEQAVIGAILYDNACIDDIYLTADDFYSTAHRLIYAAILELAAAGKVADLITVGENLTTSGNIAKVGGPAYIAETVDAVISTGAAASYAKIVKEKSIERRIISEATRIIEAVYAPEQTTSREKLEEAQKTILNLSLTNDADTLRGARELAKKTFDDIEARHNSGNTLIGHSTGLIDLDAQISGLIDGDLIILAGRPGMGKSAIAGNLAAAAASNGVPTLIFSLEMPAEAVITRLMARDSGIDSRSLRRGRLANSQWPMAVHASAQISAWPLYIDDKPDVTTTEIRAKARKLKKEAGLGLLIVDYIQLVRVTGKHDSREQAVAEISRTLKAIARELSIPVIGLSQLNRQVDSRPDRRPVLSDLRESGAIEQDADIIMFVYRDEVYHKDEGNPKKGIMEIDVAKHRNGETGRFETIFDAKTQSIKNAVKY